VNQYQSWKPDTASNITKLSLLNTRLLWNLDHRDGSQYGL
jgi:hypothetical protein